VALLHHHPEGRISSEKRTRKRECVLSGKQWKPFYYKKKGSELGGKREGNLDFFTTKKISTSTSSVTRQRKGRGLRAVFKIAYGGGSEVSTNMSR